MYIMYGVPEMKQLLLNVYYMPNLTVDITMMLVLLVVYSLNVITLTFVLLVDLMLMKEELKCVLMKYGVLSVMITGTMMMPLLYVGS